MAESRNPKKKRSPAKPQAAEAEVNLDAVAAAIAADAPPPLDEAAIEDAVASEPEHAEAAADAAEEPAVSADTAAADTAPAEVLAPNTFSTNTKEEQMSDTVNTEAENMTNKAADVAAKAQERMKAVYGKGTEMTSEAVEFGKGNVEAFVESSRILVSGLQDLGRTYADEARSAAETMQDDMRKLTSAKSPTELMQLQNEIARRNFDAMVATASRSTEAMIKLANEAFAPVSNRMSLAVDKVSHAA